jgi:hypothetical protein
MELIEGFNLKVEPRVFLSLRISLFNLSLPIVLFNFATRATPLQG